MHQLKILKQKSLPILKLTITVGLILVLVSKTDVNALLAGFKRAHVFLFGIAFAVSTLTILIRSYKWQLLLRIQGAELSLARIQSLNYMGLFFNNFFLGSVGGDAFRIYKTIQYPKSKSGAISSVAIEKLTNVITLVGLLGTFGVLNLYTNTFLITGQIYTIFTLFLVLVFMICIGMFLFAKRETGLRESSKIGKIKHEILESIAIYNSCRILITTLVLSFLFYITNIAAMYFYALAGNVEISLMHLCFIVPAVFLAVMIPISVNGIGIQEGAFFGYFSFIGVDSDSALLIAILPRIAMLLLSLVGAVLFSLESIRERQCELAKKIG